MEKYVTGEEASKLIGMSLSTLRRHADAGSIEIIKTPGGFRRYNAERYIREHTNASIDAHRICVCYCRVSTYGQADDLERQVNYMKHKYPDFEIITDIGSGINFERKGLQKIIDYAINGQLAKIAVSYKDRLCRIGYSLIENIMLKYSNTEILVEAEQPETINEEITNDLMQIITVYTAKINGMRKYKRSEF